MRIQPSRLQAFRNTFVADLLAGASGAAAGAPLSMGFAIIAGVSPIYGLYTTIVATIVGALATSSVFLTVSPTNALVLVVGSTLSAYADNDPLGHLFTLTVMVGLVQLLLGLLRAGNLFRFVSNAVMTRLCHRGRSVDHHWPVTHPRRTGQQGFWQRVVAHQRLAAAPAAGAVTDALHRPALHRAHSGAPNGPRLKYLAMLSSLIICSALVHFADWQDVLLTGDLMPVPAGMPQLVLPVPAYVPELAFRRAGHRAARLPAKRWPDAHGATAPTVRWPVSNAI